MQRPKTRGECANGLRPCPWATCAHHVASARLGNALDVPLDEWPESCTLDVADRDGATLEEVGDAIGVTRERVRQIERVAIAKLQRAGLHLAHLVDAKPVAPPPPVRHVGAPKKRGRKRKTILDHLRKVGRVCTSEQIAEAMGLRRDTVQRRLTVFYKGGTVERRRVNAPAGRHGSPWHYVYWAVGSVK